MAASLKTNWRMKEENNQNKHESIERKYRKISKRRRIWKMCGRWRRDNEGICNENGGNSLYEETNGVSGEKAEDSCRQNGMACIIEQTNGGGNSVSYHAGAIWLSDGSESEKAWGRRASE